MRSTSIRLFLADGSADGLRIVEKSNWTGRACVCSRSQFPSVKKRGEFNRTGVYLLMGLDDADQVVAYIGEGDPVLQRLESHEKNKDFWETLIVFSSKDENLNKAHIQYLESRLVQIARDANRCKLDNGNSPALPTLSEADVSDMEVFLSEMRLIFSVLGIKIFDIPEASPTETATEELLLKSASEVIARGFDRPEGFVVSKGSACVKKEAPSQNQNHRNIRASLIERGVLEERGEFYMFTQDYVFNSASMAAAVLLGRSSNGRTEWKNSSGKSLKEIQEQSA